MIHYATGDGLIRVNNAIQCIHMSEKRLAKKGELRIFNQIMETLSVNQLAEKVQRVRGNLGYDVKVDHIENPRREAEEHYYNPTYQGLIEIGVEPHYLTDEVMEGMMRVVEKFKGDIKKDVILRGIKWG